MIVSHFHVCHVTQIPSPEFDMKPQMKPEKFTLRIYERGTRFDEKIEISKEKDVAYFKVPPHRRLADADNMYDFKMVRKLNLSQINTFKMPGLIIWKIISEDEVGGINLKTTSFNQWRKFLANYN